MQRVKHFGTFIWGNLTPYLAAAGVIIIGILIGSIPNNPMALAAGISLSTNAIVVLVLYLFWARVIERRDKSEQRKFQEEVLARLSSIEAAVGSTNKPQLPTPSEPIAPPMSNGSRN